MSTTTRYPRRRGHPWTSREVIERFFDRVDIGDLDKCWPWTGGKTKAGYGTLRVDGKLTLAHRFVYQLTHGPVASGMVVRHAVCGNCVCCNIAHLAAGTTADNVADTIRMGRNRGPGDLTSRRNGRAKAKLTEEAVRAIRRQLPLTSKAALARQYGVSDTTIWRIAKGQRWKHVR